MIIGACGFVGTGSSAVSDYLREFDEVSVIDNFEFVLSHAPDGLEDLNFQLNFHCAKYTSSAVAIERFRRHFFNSVVYANKDRGKNKKLIEACDKFIEYVTQAEWQGFGAVDEQLFCGRNYENRYINMRTRKTARKIKSKISNLTGKDISGYPMHELHFSLQPDNFNLYAKQLIIDVLSILEVDFSKKIVLDQPFSGTNPCLGFPYFEDPKAIIVDRDPRDLFLLAKNYYRRNGTGYQLPVDIEEFVNYYRRLRECRFFNADDKNVLLIQFEDLIYRYEETTQKINEFCELNIEKKKSKIFDPNISVRNTQLMKRYPKDQVYVDYIEKMLPEYLYDFKEFGDVDVSGDMILYRAAKKE